MSVIVGSSMYWRVVGSGGQKNDPRKFAEKSVMSSVFSKQNLQLCVYKYRVLRNNAISYL